MFSFLHLSSCFSNLFFLSFPCKFIHIPSASSNNAVTCFKPAISCPLLSSFSFFFFLFELSYLLHLMLVFLIHSKLNVAFVVSFFTASAFLYTSVIGTISTTFSIKFSDTFPFAFICNFSSKRYIIFFYPIFFHFIHLLVDIQLLP